MRNPNFTAFSTTVAGTTDAINGDKTDSGQWVAASATLVTTGDVAGTAKFQASNDVCASSNVAQEFTPTHWADVPSATATCSAAGTKLIAKFDCSYRWLRIVFTPTAGSGSVSVLVNAVGF